MDLLTEPVLERPRHAAEPRTATEWLDALSAGSCDEDSFLRGVGEALLRAPDAGWELLALLDQYYRRGKINAEAFGNLKSHLQGVLMGNGRGGEDGTPIPRPRDDRSSTAAWSPAPAAVAPSDAGPILTTVAISPPVAVSASARTAALAKAAPAEYAPISKATRPDYVAPISKPSRAVSAAPLAKPARATAAPWGRPARAGVSTPVSAPSQTPVDRDRDADTAWPASERSLAVGDVLRGRYRVQALLGQGGMGTVFEAIDQYRLDQANADQKVALKVLHTAVIQRPMLFAELRREFQHLQSLSHPNIVRVHEFDRDGDIAFFTMEYLSGALLSRVLFAHESSPLHPSYALAIVRDVGAAVAHAHARGIVHGDLNPGNIFITDNGEVRVLDFGASHKLRRGPWISEFETPEQIAVATPSYASCQLLEGETADARDDVYALACITYALLTGNHPFGEHSALKARTLRLKPHRPRGLSGPQWKALRAGLQFARESRPQDMQAWLRRLDFRGAAAHLPVLPTLLTAHPSHRNGMRWAANGGLLALIVACAWWSVSHVDMLARAAAVVRAGVQATLANIVGRPSDNHSENIGDGRPAPVRSQPPPADVAATESPRTLESMNAPTRETPPVKTATVATHGPSRAAANMGQSDAVAALPASPAHAATATSAGAATGVAAQTANPVHARIELASDTVDVAPGAPVAHVIVHRSRSLRGTVSFNWWTESGTAKPGRDFVPVKSRVEQIDDGMSTADLLIPIFVDPARGDSRSFYVVIDAASDNAALGARTLTMVTIPGSE